MTCEHDALRPPCPTCGGKGEVWNDPATDPLHRHFHVPCPENGGNCDGKVPYERLVKVFEAVWRYDLTGAATIAKTDDYRQGWRDAVAHLRSIR